MPGEILDVTRILAPGRREPTHLPCTSGDDKGCPSIINAFEPMVTCMKPDAIWFCTTTTHRPFEFPEVAHRRYYFTPRQRISKTGRYLGRGVYTPGVLQNQDIEDYSISVTRVISSVVSGYSV